MIINLPYKIRSTQNKLADTISALDEVFSDIKETYKSQKEELERQYQNFDRRNIILKITRRMVYINKKFVLTSEDNARLDELSKLLDWLEDE